MPQKDGQALPDELKKIMIIDDDIAVTNYLMIFLMQTGRFKIKVVNDSLIVPSLLEAQKFDVLLLDMDMPGLDGIDILKRIREKQLNLPVIVLTGMSDAELAVKAMKCGAFDYLIKPVEEERLLEVIEISLNIDSTAIFTPRRLSDIQIEHVRRTLAHFHDDRRKTAAVLGITLHELVALLAHDRQE
ncbi:MAG: response regulator [Chitinispirillaceae bacterium]|nr:response regulator [Chitinispirillaceae bacterium]